MTCIVRNMRTAIVALFFLTPQAARSAEQEIISVYVPTRDGTRLAVDVLLPAKRAPGAKFPALVELTRYWRASENLRTGKPKSPLDEWERAFLKHGYAVVTVDVRGSGASFGTRDIEYGPQEVQDGFDIVEWIVHQPWSDGNVGAHGISYSGTTAELLTATGHPAVKAVSPGWSDFDSWRSPARPYGLLAADFINVWGQYVGMLDRNDPTVGSAVKRVDEDGDGKLRASAVKQHAANVNVAKAVSAVKFRDQALLRSKHSFADMSVLRWKKEIEASGVPMLVFASWFDAGGAEGALWRLANFSNTQFIVMQASCHGGVAHASPYTVNRRPKNPIPSIAELIKMRIQFFDHYLKGIDNDVVKWPKVRYFNLGEEEFHNSDHWPPSGAKAQRMYASAEGVLSTVSPSDENGADTYKVDFEVSTGSSNRWMSQLGQPVLGLGDRYAMDKRMLTYTSPPLEEDMQISGTPVAHLEITSTCSDGAVLLYLEDVGPDNRSRYITEGGLRLLHRKVHTNPGFEAYGPVHSFAREDAEKMVPGEPATVEIRLNPISVRVSRGHRLRLAIAGADAAIFQRVPKNCTPTLTIDRNATRPTYIELPVVTP